MTYLTSIYTNLYTQQPASSTFLHLRPDTLIAFIACPYDTFINRVKIWIPELTSAWTSKYGNYFTLHGEAILRVKEVNGGVSIKAFGVYTKTIIQMLEVQFRLGKGSGRWQGDRVIRPDLCRLRRLDSCIDFDDSFIPKQLLVNLVYDLRMGMSHKPKCGAYVGDSEDDVSFYMGSKESAFSICVYNKTAQLRKKGVYIPNQVYRLELRQIFSKDKRYLAYRTPVSEMVLGNGKIRGVLEGLDLFFNHGVMPKKCVDRPVFNAKTASYLAYLDLDDEVALRMMGLESYDYDAIEDQVDQQLEDDYE